MRRPILAGLAAGFATACLWLALGSQPSLPEYHRQVEGWSGDYRSYYLPNAAYAGSRLAVGELPLWNPHQGLGDPFLAALQVGALYPPNWLHGLLPAATAFVVLVFLHLVFAGVTVGYLAWRLGACTFGCAVAAVAYAGSWQLVGAIYSPPLVYAAAWAPLLWAMVDGLTARVTPGRVALLALSVAMMLLCGWPYTLVIVGFGAAVYGGTLLVAAVVQERRVPFPALLALLGAVLAGAMLAAPQLLATQELLARSCRALGSVVEGQAVFVKKPHSPIHFWHTFARYGYNGAIPGVAVLLLAFAAMALPGRGRLRCVLLLAVGGLGVLISFPNDFPLYGWLRELPLFADFRFPFRYRLLASLALAATAGVGTTHLAARLGRWPLLSAAIGPLALAVCALTVAAPSVRAVLPFPRSVPAPESLRAELRALGVEVGEYERVYWAGRANKRGTETDLDVLYDMEPMSLARTAEVITFFETGRPRTLVSLPHELDATRPRGDSVAAPFYGHLNLPGSPDRAAILDILAIRWIVAPDPPAWLSARYRRASREGAPLAVFENPGAMPRAYRVTGALPAPPKLGAALRAMTRAAFDPRALVLLDDPPPALVTAARARVVDPEAFVAIEHFDEDRIVLRTGGDRPGVVVLADAWFPGWIATVDGVEVPVRRANTALRGVVVPAGEHRLEMRYRSAPLARGAVFAGAAAASLLLYGLVARRRATR